VRTIDVAYGSLWVLISVLLWSNQPGKLRWENMQNSIVQLNCRISQRCLTWWQQEGPTWWQYSLPLLTFRHLGLLHLHANGCRYTRTEWFVLVYIFRPMLTVRIESSCRSIKTSTQLQHRGDPETMAFIALCVLRDLRFRVWRHVVWRIDANIFGDPAVLVFMLFRPVFYYGDYVHWLSDLIFIMSRVQFQPSPLIVK